MRQLKIVFNKIQKNQTDQCTRNSLISKHPQDSFHNQELQELIPVLLKMLDVLHSLPFQTGWQKCHLIQILIKFLKSAESLTLTAWKSSNPQKYLQLWSASQKRHEGSLLMLYCQFSEQLLHWSKQVPQEWIGSKNLWQDYGFFILLNDLQTKNYFNACPYQDEQIARHYLYCMQSIFQTHFEELVRRLFIWISHWTKESYFLPTLKSQLKNKGDKNDDELSELQQWKVSLLESENWQNFASDYLSLLDLNESQ